MEQLKSLFARECAACLRTVRALHTHNTANAGTAQPLLQAQLVREVEAAFGAAVAITDRVARGSAFEAHLLQLRSAGCAAARRCQLAACVEALSGARTLLAAFHADLPECQPADGSAPGAYSPAYALPQDAVVASQPGVGRGIED